MLPEQFQVVLEMSLTIDNIHYRWRNGSQTSPLEIVKDEIKNAIDRLVDVNDIFNMGDQFKSEKFLSDLNKLELSPFVLDELVCEIVNARIITLHQIKYGPLLTLRAAAEEPQENNGFFNTFQSTFIAPMIDAAVYLWDGLVYLVNAFVDAIYRVMDTIKAYFSGVGSDLGSDAGSDLNSSTNPVRNPYSLFSSNKREESHGSDEPILGLRSTIINP